MPSCSPVLHMTEEVVVQSLRAVTVHRVTEVQILCFHFLILFLVKQNKDIKVSLTSSNTCYDMYESTNGRRTVRKDNLTSANTRLFLQTGSCYGLTKVPK